MVKNKNQLATELDNVERQRVEAEKKRLIDEYRQQMYSNRAEKAKEHYEMPAAEAWQGVRKLNERDQEYHGYDNFLALMLQMLAMHEILGRALAYSLMKKVNEIIMAIATHLDGRKTYDDLQDVLGPITPAQKRGFVVEMNDQDQLTFDALETLPSGVNKQVKGIVQDVVETWLDGKEYKLESDGNGIIVKAKQGDAQLDKRGFEALRDGENGIGAFLRDTLNQYFDYQPSNSPSP